MSRTIRIGEFLIVIAIILVAFIAGSLTSSFIAASQVESHIDATISQTVKDATNNPQQKQFALDFQKMVRELDTTCQEWKKQDPAIQCK